MLSDIQMVIKWWLYILLLGIIFLPFSQKYFNRFLDRGYIFSKCLGIVVTSYIVWLLSSLHILRFSKLTELSVMLSLFVLVFLLYRKHLLIPRKQLGIYIAEELFFLCLIAFWSYVRAHQPNVYGLEKFMDFGFVNSLLRTDYMPPLDIWHASKAINYYYYGHYICAFLIRLTGMEASVSYNLMLALIFAFAFMMSFSLVANTVYMVCNKNTVRKAIIAGLISALLVALGGNLHCFVYEYAKPYYQQVKHLPADEHKYYYPDSTRYIGYNPSTHDKTIHEFPIYSFVVSDLHGHVSDIPMVLTFLSLLLVLALRKRTVPWKSISIDDVLIALFLAVMYMTNTWDYPIYITVFLLVTSCFSFSKAFENAGKEQKISVKGCFIDLLANWLKVIAMSQLFILPFKLKFVKIAGGVDFVHAHTPIYQFLILWGHQLFFIISFIIFMLVIVYKEHKQSSMKSELLWQLMKKTASSDMYILILCFSALGLLIIPEIVYVVDIYSGDYQRANTMFKLTYQAFIMAGLVSGYAAVRILEYFRRNALKLVVTTLMIMMITLPLLYPISAIRGYYRSLSISSYKGLYGMSFLEDISSGDAAAVQWFNDNVAGQPTILEADGDSYTDYERISAMTGLPTVEGWFVHEWLWRSSKEDPIARSQETASVYESDDSQKTMEIINKYDIKYIVLGELERMRYKNLKTDKLMSLGEKVFEQDGTAVIRVRE